MFSIFKKLNNFANRWGVLDVLAIFCARILPYVLVFILILMSLILKNLYLFLIPIVSGVLARGLNELVHLFYKEERPSTLYNAKVLIPVPKNLSFPSGHASFFFGLSFALILYNVALATIFIMCSCIIGLSRVFCGVHYFRDILAGSIMGIISSLIVYYCA